MAYEKQFSLHKRPTSPAEREKKRAGKRYNGVWYVQFKLPSGGFSTAKSTKQTSQGAAEAWAVEQIRTGNIPQASTDRSSIKGYIGAFWTRTSPYVREFGEPDEEGYSAPISEAHLGNRKRQADYFVEWCRKRGLTEVRKIDRRTLADYRDHINATKKSPSTRSDYWRAVTIPIERAVADGRLNQNPIPPTNRTATARATRAHRRKANSGRTAFDMPELVKLLAPSKWLDLRARTGALLALTCSMRRGEIRGLLWENIHGDYLDVVTSWRDEEKEHIGPPKWSHERYHVPIPAALALELKALKPSPEATGLVFHPIGESERAMGPRYFMGALYAAGQQCKPVIDINSRTGFHSLRHSYVSASDARIIEERRAALRAVAGHNDEHTQQAYRTVLKTEEERIAGEWDQWLRENKLTIMDVKSHHDGLQLYNRGVIAEARQERKDEAKQAG